MNITQTLFKAKKKGAWVLQEEPGKNLNSVRGYEVSEEERAF